MNCHNGEKYLKESLKSLFNQSYKNWELVFFDNNSNDNSGKILKSFKDKRIRFFSSKKKLNLYHARNLAIKKTKGHYVCFLDIDDLYHKDKLKLQINFLKKNREFKIIYSNYTVLDEIKKKKYIKYSKKLKSGFITQSLLKDYTIGILTALIDKKIIKKKFFNDKYSIVGDFDLFLKLSLKNKIAYMKKPLSIYRIHSNNYSTNNLKEYYNELRNWISKNRYIFKKYTFLYLYYYLIKLRIKLILKFLPGV